MLSEGTKAPTFTLTDHNGNQVSLSDFNDRYVILWWYPKAATPG